MDAAKLGCRHSVKYGYPKDTSQKDYPYLDPNPGDGELFVIGERFAVSVNILSVPAHVLPIDMRDHSVRILLDEERYEKVAREAAARGISVVAVIRDAIDRLPTGVSERRAAVDAILSAVPMSVPEDPAALRRELGEAHDRIGK